MKLERIVKELTQAIEQLGLTVRFEEGRFQSGKCLLGNKEVIMLNKRHPAEVHFSVLSNCLQSLPVEDIYLKPSVRSALEQSNGVFRKT